MALFVRPGRFFHDVPRHYDALRLWLTSRDENDAKSALYYVKDEYAKHISHHLHTPVSTWTKIQNIVVTHMPNPNEHGVELVEWGLNQPWADEVRIHRVINDALGRNPLVPPALSSPWVTLASRVPPHYRKDVTSALVKYILPDMSAQAVDRKTLQAWATLLADAWGYHTDHRYLKMQWRNACVTSFSKMPFQEQCNLLLETLVPLGNSHFIWSIMTHSLNPNVWLKEKDAIKTLYGHDESVLFEHLPLVDSALRENQKLINAFCPTWSPALMALLSEDDWKEPSRIRSIDLMPGPVTSLALPPVEPSPDFA